MYNFQHSRGLLYVESTLRVLKFVWGLSVPSNDPWPFLAGCQATWAATEARWTWPLSTWRSIAPPGWRVVYFVGFCDVKMEETTNFWDFCSQKGPSRSLSDVQIRIYLWYICDTILWYIYDRWVETAWYRLWHVDPRTVKQSPWLWTASGIPAINNSWCQFYQHFFFVSSQYFDLWTPTIAGMERPPPMSCALTFQGV